MDKCPFPIRHDIYNPGSFIVCKNKLKFIRMDGVPSCGQHVSSKMNPIVKLEEKDESISCSVCHVEEGAYIKLECSHWYHPMCIKNWLNKSLTCPLCRSRSINIVAANETIPKDLPNIDPVIEAQNILKTYREFRENFIKHRNIHGVNNNHEVIQHLHETMQLLTDFNGKTKILDIEAHRASNTNVASSSNIASSSNVAISSDIASGSNVASSSGINNNIPEEASSSRTMSALENDVKEVKSEINDIKSVIEMLKIHLNI